ncbi:MAG: DUF4097 family beta strand repeat-containing protein [Acidobacteria bacterium]|nr:DUF4097 family beta strand repeat-containing protein [Acidobacteriota bacterium]
MSNGATGTTTYRRGSVFGALLLIAIGMLFLYANMNPEFSPWQVLARYWPVLIIFWGLSRLADYFILRNTDQAAAVTRIGAGDIIGLIFILIFGTILTQMVRWGSGDRPWGPWVFNKDVGCLFGQEQEFTEQLEQAWTPGERLELSDLRGDVTVTAAAAPQLRINVRKRFCAPNPADAESLNQNVHPVLERAPDGFRLRMEGVGNLEPTPLVRTDLDVQLPAARELVVGARHGDVILRGTSGNVTLRVEHGDVVIESVKGDVSLDVRHGDVSVADVSGSVRVDGRGDEVELRNIGGSAAVLGEYGGPIRLSSIQGPARFESRRTRFTASKIEGEFTTSGGFRLRGVPGDVQLETKDYDIEAEDVTGEINITNRNGPVRLQVPRAPRYPISIETRNGDIELTLPADSGFKIDATARDGEIESDFEGPGLQKSDDRHDNATLAGTVGNGAVAIKLATTHGVIRLRRR